MLKEINKALLVKSLREITQLVPILTANANRRYPRGRDQHEYSFTIR